MTRARAVLALRVVLYAAAAWFLGCAIVGMAQVLYIAAQLLVSR